MSNRSGGTKINLSYPRNELFEFTTRMEVLNMETERENDLMTDNGFVISPFKGIKKDIKDDNGIFSRKYGQTLKDINPTANRFRCRCGFTHSRLRLGYICPLCEEEVKYVDDNFNYFGWKILLHDEIIHPLLYKQIESYIGKNELDSILTFERENDIDGNILPFKSEDPSHPFYHLGMQGFKERFDEIMDFYQKPNKQHLYDFIMHENRDKVFIHSIPVYTTMLRPFDIDGRSLYHEDSNPKYNMMNKLASELNKMKDSDRTGEKNKIPQINKLLRNLQLQYSELYDYITDILSTKKGVIRQLFGGRYNFSSRCVIVAGNDLRIDQVRLPYKCLVEWLDPQIKNILVKSYNITYNEAEELLFKAKVKPNKTVGNIINSIIKSHKYGLPVIINRNPSINFGLNPCKNLLK